MTAPRTASSVETVTVPSQPLARARSQRLLITLLGDYWDPEGSPLPSSGLVRILEEFGIPPTNTRAALRRLTERGVLERTKEGRHTRYAPTERTVRLLERGGERIFSQDEGLQWDGTWTLIAFSLPLGDEDLRRLLRARLRWLTFWPIYDATWVTPHDRLDAAREQLADLEITDALVLRTTDVDVLPGGHARLEEAWGLDELAEAYLAYNERFSPLWDRARRGDVDPVEALVERGQLVDSWRVLVRDDPDLPLEFLPEDFPRSLARRLFLDTYAALAEPAGARFDELIAAS